tara:strand:+ start:4616 stop:6265 length:1650 start_codon:yes stop_codon:yes gene_type:complete
MESKKVIVNAHNGKPSLKAEAILVSFVFVIIGVGMFLSFSMGITGNVSLSVETSYDPNSTLDGTLKLALKPGELIPKDSVIAVSMGNDSYDFVLSDLVDVDVISGEFYSEGGLLVGSGEGYGIIGSKDIFSDVEFSMRVFDEGSGSSSSGSGKDKNQGKGNGGGSGSSGSDSEEEVEVEEEVDEEVEEVIDDSEEEIVEEIEVEEVEEDQEVEETEESEEEELIEEEELEEEEAVEEEESGEEEVEEEEIEEVEEEESESSVITGEVVASFEKIVEGVVRGDGEYTYELGDGQAAEIVSSSQEVSLSVEGNLVTVTTSYSEGEEGFGVEYLGEEFEYEVEIDLTALELEVVEGELTVSLNYEDSEIVSTSVILDVEDPNQVSSTLTTLPLESENIEDFSLDEREVFALKAGSGVSVAEITKAEEVNNRLLIRFEAGKYWLENSYDLDEEDLKYQVELDRVKFMKRLSRSFLVEEDESKEVEGFVGVESLIAPLDEVEEVVEEVEEEVVEESEEIVEEEVVEEVVVEEVVEDDSEVSIEDIQQAFEEATS